MNEPNCFTLPSGLVLNLDKPSPSMVHPRDIIDIFSRLPIFAGNQETGSRLSWTWAQRAVAASYFVDLEYLSAALLYHAPIVYLGDIPQHLQEMMQQYEMHSWFRDLFGALQQNIFEALGVSWPLDDQAKERIEAAYSKVEAIERCYLQAVPIAVPGNHRFDDRPSFLDHVHPNDFEKYLTFAGIKVPPVDGEPRSRLLNTRGGNANG